MKAVAVDTARGKVKAEVHASKIAREDKDMALEGVRRSGKTQICKETGFDPTKP